MEKKKINIKDIKIIIIVLYTHINNIIHKLCNIIYKNNDTQRKTHSLLITSRILFCDSTLVEFVVLVEADVVAVAVLFSICLFCSRQSSVVRFSTYLYETKPILWRDDSSKSDLWQQRFGCLWQQQSMLLSPCLSELFNMPATVCNTKDMVPCATCTTNQYLAKYTIRVQLIYCYCKRIGNLRKYPNVYFDPVDLRGQYLRFVFKMKCVVHRAVKVTIFSRKSDRYLSV